MIHFMSHSAPDDSATQLLLKTGQMRPFILFFLFRHAFAILGALHFCLELRINLSTKKRSLNFDRDGFNFIDQSEK